jgi:hypothetical protein
MNIIDRYKRAAIKKKHLKPAAQDKYGLNTLPKILI